MSPSTPSLKQKAGHASSGICPLGHGRRSGHRQHGAPGGPAIGGMDYGQPLSLIGEEVFARYLSALKEELLRS